MTVTPEVFRVYIQQYVGWEYGFYDRCGGSHHEFDCSGLQCHGTNGTGLTHNVCTSSFVMASQCWNLGLYMPENVATAENGPDGWWAFHGFNYGRTDNGSRANGGSGHIVYVVRTRDANGHTTGFYTIEAMGRRYGVVNGSFWGRGWTGHYKIPGMSHAPPPPKVKPQMAQQLNARLYNKQTHGWFEGYADGRVDYLAPNGTIAHGGMTSDHDRVNFAGRTLADLEERWYIRKSDKKHIFGFLIRATSNETYIPEAQH